jgi:serine/threonine kinase 32
MSYYPHNQPIAAVGADYEGTLAHSTTGTIVPTASIIDRSQAGSPMMESSDVRNIPPIPYGSQSHAVS